MVSLELLRTGSAVTVHAGSGAGGTQSLYITPAAGQTLIVHMLRFYHNDNTAARAASVAVGVIGSEQPIWFSLALADHEQVAMPELGFVAPLILPYLQRLRVTVESLGAGKLLYLSNHHYVVLQK